MSLDDVLGRIQQLQSLIEPPATTGADSGAATATTAGGQDFSSALASATGTSSTLTPQAMTASAALYGGTSSGLYSNALAASSPLTSGLGGVTNVPALTAGTTGGDIVADSMKYLGVPYRWGGTDPTTGLDCSGLVQKVFADKGITLPRVSADQATMGTEVQGGLANAQPGDLVFFGSPVHHVGIYAGNNTMVEAPHTGTNVQVHSIDETPTHVRRISLPPAVAAAGAVGTVPASPMASLTALAGEDPATALDKLGVPASLRNVLTSAAQSQGLPVSLLAAVAKVESGFDPTSVSSAGAQGLMQLMPDTAAGLGANPWDPMSAANGAAKLLRGYLDKYNSIPLALAAYNAGPGAVAKYNGIPPYAETQAYVQRVGALAAAA